MIGDNAFVLYMYLHTISEYGFGVLLDAANIIKREVPSRTSLIQQG